MKRSAKRRPATERRPKQHFSTLAEADSLACHAAMNTRHYRDLMVWQRSMDLARNVYAVSREFPKEEIYGLTSQLRRAAVSIPSNIAEGHGRLSDRNFAAFLAQARGSLYELETQLELAETLGYFERRQFRQLLEKSTEVARMLNALLNTLRVSQAR